jgi:hypothetical protein
MLDSFDRMLSPVAADNEHSDKDVAARARAQLVQESRQELLRPVAAEKPAAVSKAGDSQSQSYLQTWIDAGTSRIISNDETRNTVNHLGSEFVKTASLFTAGKLGLAGTFVAYGLDQASPHDSWKAQAADFALGGSKGATMKCMFSVIGTGGQIAPLKGALMGLGSGAIDEVFTRETFTDPSSLNDRLRKNAFNPGAVMLNAAVFTAGEGLYAGINAASKGALAKNALASGMVMGGSFGFVNGTVGEASREMHEKGSLDPGKVLWHGVLNGGVSAAGAGVGMKVSDPVFQQKMKDSALNVLESVGLRPGNESRLIADRGMKRAELHIGRAEEAIAVQLAQQIFLDANGGSLALHSELQQRDSNPGLVIDTTMQDANGKPVSVRSEVSSWGFNPVLSIDSTATDAQGKFLKSTHNEMSRHESNPVLTGEGSELDASGKVVSKTYSELRELPQVPGYIIESSKCDAGGKAVESFHTEVKVGAGKSVLTVDTARMDASGRPAGFAHSELSRSGKSQGLSIDTSIKRD